MYTMNMLHIHSRCQSTQEVFVYPIASIWFKMEKAEVVVASPKGMAGESLQSGTGRYILQNENIFLIF